MLMRTDMATIPFVKGREGLSMLADALEVQLPHNFQWDFQNVLDQDYGLPDTECGYVGCACGLATVLWPKEFNLPEVIGMYEGLGSPKRHFSDMFGIPENVAKMLFFPQFDFDATGIPTATAKEVAENIRHFLKTGECKPYDKVPI